MENTMKKVIAALVLLSASTAAFAAPAVAKAIADCCSGDCPGCPDCPDGK